MASGPAAVGRPLNAPVSRKRVHGGATASDTPSSRNASTSGSVDGSVSASGAKKRPRNNRKEPAPPTCATHGNAGAAAEDMVVVAERKPVVLLTPRAGGPFTLDPMPTPFISARAERCLVLDNDETTGSYQLGSLLFSMYMSLCASPPPQQLFVDEYLKRGGVRPGTVALLRRAAALRDAGRLDHIVMFTAASNKNGWVTFLRDCLERLAELPPGTISRVITMEHCSKRNQHGRLIKDLRLVCSNTSNVVMVDDKPEFVQHGRVVQVAEYTQHTPIDALVERMPCSEQHRRIARQALVDDAQAHAPCGEDFSNDDQMTQVADIVERLFT